MTKSEKWLLLCGALVLWVFLAYFAGGPIYSDEMLYIDVGLRNLAEPHYGNRYFHIYLQKFFMSIAPTPLAGIRIFWALLMSLTASLVYLNARKLVQSSTIFNGLLAASFFFAFSIVREYSGEPAVDITAMAVVMIYLTVYLDLLKRGGKGKYHVFALGLLAFLGLKTKETTIFMHLLLFGLLDKKILGKGWLRSTLKYFSPFLIGIASGIFIFIILDGIFLGRPFFAISPSTFKGVFDNYDFTPGFFFGPTSWYTEYLFDDILMPFSLFLLSGILLREKLDLQKRIIWVYPLIYIAFLSWNMLKVPWGFIERFAFPIMPVIAIFSAQVVTFQIPKDGKRRLLLGVGLAATVLIFFLMRQVWIDTARAYTFDHYRLLEAVYFPIVLSILFASLIWEKAPDWLKIPVQIFCIGTLLFTPLSYNVKYFIQYPQVRERFDEVFYPLEVFQPNFTLDETDTVYISTDFKNGLDMLSTDPNDISGMINFYYDEKFNRENIFVGYDRKKVAADLINRSFDFALLTAGDLSSLENSTAWQKISEQYQHIFSDEAGTVYLLKR
jgi:hypothetical protein